MVYFQNQQFSQSNFPISLSSSSTEWRWGVWPAPQLPWLGRCWSPQGETAWRSPSASLVCPRRAPSEPTGTPAGPAVMPAISRILHPGSLRCSSVQCSAGLWHLKIKLKLHWNHLCLYYIVLVARRNWANGSKYRFDEDSKFTYAFSLFCQTSNQRSFLKKYIKKYIWAERNFYNMRRRW